MSENSRKLSTDEVNALMEGLSTGDVSGSSGVGTELEVAPFSFGADDLSLMGDYYALRLINERFARFARSVFQPMLRVQPRISSFPPEVKSFDEYLERKQARIDEKITKAKIKEKKIRTEALKGAVDLVS